jgi:excisionase family DNA binding protein
MAGMFYTIQEVAVKLGKTEAEIRELVKQGKLREFRDGAKILFKVNEVDALVGSSEPMQEETTISLTPLEDTVSMPQVGDSSAPIDLTDELLSPTSSTEPMEFDISEDLAPPKTPGSSTSGPINLDEDITAPKTPGSSTSGPIDLGDMGSEEGFDLSKDDTQMTGEGLNVLGGADTEYKITDDTMGKTRAPEPNEPSLEKIEEDVNLDSFGSGSGLLDLSLQADDTSLGGVLDEIYPGADIAQGEAAAEPAAPIDVAAEAEILSETASASAEPAAYATAYAEPEPDAASNMTGLMLVIPLLAAIYTIIVAASAVNGTSPIILTAVQEIIWFVLIGAAVISLIIMALGFVFGGRKKLA